jgi:hypothetical protein
MGRDRNISIIIPRDHVLVTGATQQGSTNGPVPDTVRTAELIKSLEKDLQIMLDLLVILMWYQE